MNRLTTVLTNELNKACPLSPARTINRNNPWFTPQLKRLRKEVGASYRKCKENPIEQNKSIYKDRLERYKKLLKKTNNNYHTKYVASIKNEEEMSHFVKGLLKQKTAARPSSLKRPGGSYTKSRGGPTRAGLYTLSITQTYRTLNIQ